MAATGATPEYAGPSRLRQLLDAVLAVASDFDVSSVLRHIVESAVELVDARYGGLGLLDETGTELAQFITVGIDEAGARTASSSQISSTLEPFGPRSTGGIRWLMQPARSAT